MKVGKSWSLPVGPDFWAEVPDVGVANLVFCPTVVLWPGVSCVPLLVLFAFTPGVISFVLIPEGMKPLGL